MRKSPVFSKKKGGIRKRGGNRPITLLKKGKFGEKGGGGWDEKKPEGERRLRICFKGEQTGNLSEPENRDKLGEGRQQKRSFDSKGDKN